MELVFKYKLPALKGILSIVLVAFQDIYNSLLHHYSFRQKSIINTATYQSLEDADIIIINEKLFLFFHKHPVSSAYHFLELVWWRFIVISVFREGKLKPEIVQDFTLNQKQNYYPSIQPRVLSTRYPHVCCREIREVIVETKKVTSIPRTWFNHLTDLSRHRSYFNILYFKIYGIIIFKGK